MHIRAFYLLMATCGTLVSESHSNQQKIAPERMDFFGVRYLDHLEYACDPTTIPPATEKNPRPHYNPQRYIDDLKDKKTAPVYIRYVNNHCGYGVFAAQDIPAGKLIGEYTGIVRPRNFSKRTSDYDYAWGFPPPTKFVIDAKDAGNFTRFINHNDDNNVDMIYVTIEGRWHLAYVAKKHIPQDKQLLADYQAPYWKGRGYKPEALE